MTDEVIPVEVFFIKPYTPRFTLEITRSNGNVDNVSNRNITSEFTYPVTTAIGTFSSRLSNVGGRISNLYFPGDTITLSADMSDGTTTEFIGRIDRVSEVKGSDGQFLDIAGRHRAFELVETYVTAKFENVEISQILKDLVQTFLPTTYTANNVNNTGQKVTVQWDNKMFLHCVIDLCNLAKLTGTSFDFFVDNNRDFYFFAEKSRVNNDEAIVEGDNLITLRDFGDDSYEVRDKVTVRGQDSDGLPIVYTSGTGIREYNFQDNNIKTFNQAKETADALANELVEAVDKGSARTKWLETLTPGDYIRLSVPTQRIQTRVRIIEFKTIIEGRVMWSELQIERRLIGLNAVLASLSSLEYTTKTSNNPNALRFSFNMSFDDATQIASSTNLSVSNGDIRQITLGTSGQFTSLVTTTLSDIKKVELQVVGQDLDACVFSVSVDEGDNFTTITPNVLANISTVGNRLIIRATLTDNATNLLPILKGLSLLYT